jgi:hypothetical protein
MGVIVVVGKANMMLLVVVIFVVDVGIVDVVIGDLESLWLDGLCCSEVLAC